MSINPLDTSTPAWSRQQKVRATLILTIFVSVCSSLIGYGFYQEKHKNELALNRQSILGILSQDTAFIRAMHQAAREKVCVNETLNFHITYTSPLRPSFSTGDTACLEFTAIHPNGQPIRITISHNNRSRKDVVTEESQQFSIIQTDLMSLNQSVISRLIGLKQQVSTTAYVIESKTGSWLIHYSPTSPTVDKKAEALALSLREIK